MPVVRFVLVSALSLLAAACAGQMRREPDTVVIPALLRGDFTDDYRGKFTISDTLWFQRPRNRFRIVSWHVDEQYLIAQNASDDPTAPNLWTRIDWMRLPAMQPFEWGFCLTAYQAVSAKAAAATPPADRANPRTGCNGFPFTRMQRADA